MTKEEEAKLMKASLRDAKKLSIIYMIYLPKILGYVYRQVLNQGLAEEITSEVFIRVLEKRLQFQDQGHGVGAWIYRIAQNCVTDHYRREQKFPQIEVEELDWLIIEKKISLMNYL